MFLVILLHLHPAISAVETLTGFEHVFENGFGMLIDLCNLVEYRAIFAADISEVFFFNLLEFGFVFKYLWVAHILIVLLLDVTHYTKVFLHLAPFVTFGIVQNFGDLLV